MADQSPSYRYMLEWIEALPVPPLPVPPLPTPVRTPVWRDRGWADFVQGLCRLHPWDNYKMRIVHLSVFLLDEPRTALSVLRPPCFLLRVGGGFVLYSHPSRTSYASLSSS